MEMKIICVLLFSSIFTFNANASATASVKAVNNEYITLRLLASWDPIAYKIAVDVNSQLADKCGKTIPVFEMWDTKIYKKLYKKLSVINRKSEVNVKNYWNVIINIKCIPLADY